MNSALQSLKFIRVHAKLVQTINRKAICTLHLHRKLKFSDARLLRKLQSSEIVK